jgi:putative RNA 2'-phosphotransferase
MSVEISKFLSYVLRHAPESIGLVLDNNGWARVGDLLTKANAAGTRLDMATLQEVVETSPKKRFTLSHDLSLIRAAQGHSVEVDLALTPTAPPTHLYHGTAEQSVASIRASGLEARSRQHVHLSADVETATKVGARHGRPVVLLVQAGKMSAAGHTFWKADNGVWLADAVPPEFITTSSVE